MKFTPKPLSEQVLVITGASSGIGRITAVRAAARGAKVLLVARDEPALESAVRRIEEAGGEALFMIGDVADPVAHETAAQVAVEAWGRVDCWVNNAGVSIYGRTEEVPLDDARRLFDVNYWGVVHGSLVALKHLRAHGGVLINMGSIVSDRAIPLQGHYGATKHAVKAFTETLRMEVEDEGAPIAITLIKPGSIGTRYADHARNLMNAEPTLPPPVYDPEVVAEAILACAEHPRRELTVGGSGRILIGAGRLMPRVMDRYMRRSFIPQQKSDRAHDLQGRDNLYEAIPGSGRTYGELDRRLRRRSLYTSAVLHPGVFAATMGLLAVGIGAAVATLRG